MGHLPSRAFGARADWNSCPGGHASLTLTGSNAGLSGLYTKQTAQFNGAPVWKGETTGKFIYLCSAAGSGDDGKWLIGGEDMSSKPWSECYRHTALGLSESVACGTRIISIPAGVTTSHSSQRNASWLPRTFALVRSLEFLPSSLGPSLSPHLCLLVPLSRSPPLLSSSFHPLYLLSLPLLD
jgi:hypothetical protein